MVRFLNYIITLFIMFMLFKYLLQFTLFTIQKEKGDRSLEEVHKPYHVAL